MNIVVARFEGNRGSRRVAISNSFLFPKPFRNRFSFTIPRFFENVSGRVVDDGRLEPIHVHRAQAAQTENEKNSCRYIYRKNL